MSRVFVGEGTDGGLSIGMSRIFIFFFMLRVWTWLETWFNILHLVLMLRQVVTVWLVQKPNLFTNQQLLQLLSVSHAFILKSVHFHPKILLKVRKIKDILFSLTLWSAEWLRLKFKKVKLNCDVLKSKTAAKICKTLNKISKEAIIICINYNSRTVAKPTKQKLQSAKLLIEALKRWLKLSKLNIQRMLKLKSAKQLKSFKQVLKRNKLHLKVK